MALQVGVKNMGLAKQEKEMGKEGDEAPTADDRCGLRLRLWLESPYREEPRRYMSYKSVVPDLPVQTKNVTSSK